MNGTEVRDIATAFAKRILASTSENSATDRRIAQAYALAYQRAPEPGEIEKASAFLTEYVTQADEMSAWTALCRSLLVSHEFFHVD
jgi:hypothetical protein